MSRKLTQGDDQAVALVSKWASDPDASKASRIAAALMSGEWLTAAETAERFECASSMLSQGVQIMRRAGLNVVSRPAGTSGLMSYSVDSSRPARRSKRVDDEQAGVTHPNLGAVLTVRALVLDSQGDLVMQLSNGKGSCAVKVNRARRVSVADRLTVAVVAVVCVVLLALLVALSLYDYAP